MREGKRTKRLLTKLNIFLWNKKVQHSLCLADIPSKEYSVMSKSVRDHNSKELMFKFDQQLFERENRNNILHNDYSILWTKELLREKNWWWKNNRIFELLLFDDDRFIENENSKERRKRKRTNSFSLSMNGECFHSSDTYQIIFDIWMNKFSCR